MATGTIWVAPCTLHYLSRLCGDEALGLCDPELTVKPRRRVSIRYGENGRSKSFTYHSMTSRRAFRLRLFRQGRRDHPPQTRLLLLTVQPFGRPRHHLPPRRYMFSASFTFSPQVRPRPRPQSCSPLRASMRSLLTSSHGWVCMTWSCRKSGV